jgi:hypothetical protein
LVLLHVLVPPFAAARVVARHPQHRPHKLNYFVAAMSSRLSLVASPKDRPWCSFARGAEERREGNPKSKSASVAISAAYWHTPPRPSSRAHKNRLGKYLRRATSRQPHAGAGPTQSTHGGRIGVEGQGKTAGGQRNRRSRRSSETPLLMSQTSDRHSLCAAFPRTRSTYFHAS